MKARLLDPDRDFDVTASPPAGHEDLVSDLELGTLLGERVQREWVVFDPPVETDPEGTLWDAMAAALMAEDPDGRVVPYMLSGGTDAKSFSRLGIRCFGFAPLKLPAELDFTGMFHGIDERVPVESLQFGARALDRFLMSS